MQDPENIRFIPELEIGRIKLINEKLNTAGASFTIADYLLIYEDLESLKLYLSSQKLVDEQINNAITILKKDQSRIKNIVSKMMGLNEINKNRVSKALGKIFA